MWCKPSTWTNVSRSSYYISHSDLNKEASLLSVAVGDCIPLPKETVYMLRGKVEEKTVVVSNMVHILEASLPPPSPPITPLPLLSHLMTTESPHFLPTNQGGYQSKLNSPSSLEFLPSYDYVINCLRPPIAPIVQLPYNRRTPHVMPMTPSPNFSSNFFSFPSNGVRTQNLMATSSSLFCNTLDFSANEWFTSVPFSNSAIQPAQENNLFPEHTKTPFIPPTILSDRVYDSQAFLTIKKHIFSQHKGNNPLILFF